MSLGDVGKLKSGFHKIETIVSDNHLINEEHYNNVLISVTCSGTASLEISKPYVFPFLFNMLIPLEIVPIAQPISITLPSTFKSSLSNTELICLAYANAI